MTNYFLNLFKHLSCFQYYKFHFISIITKHSNLRYCPCFAAVFDFMRSSLQPYASFKEEHGRKESLSPGPDYS